MFDIGFSELLLIALLALVVLGPERLPRAARFAGLWVRRARAQWHSVRGELERELAAEDLRRSLDEGRRALDDAEAHLTDMHAGARAQLQDLARETGAVPSPDRPVPAADTPASRHDQDTDGRPPAA